MVQHHPKDEEEGHSLMTEVLPDHRNVLAIDLTLVLLLETLAHQGQDLNRCQDLDPGRLLERSRQEVKVEAGLGHGRRKSQLRPQRKRRRTVLLQKLRPKLLETGKLSRMGIIRAVPNHTQRMVTVVTIGMEVEDTAVVLITLPT